MDAGTLIGYLLIWQHVLDQLVVRRVSRDLSQRYLGSVVVEEARDCQGIVPDHSFQRFGSAPFASVFVKKLDCVEMVVNRRVVHDLSGASFTPILVEKSDHLKVIESCGSAHGFGGTTLNAILVQERDYFKTTLGCSAIYCITRWSSHIGVLLSREREW